ncbi:MAG: ATP-binding protein, partial [Acidobacteriota bacterium]
TSSLPRRMIPVRHTMAARIFPSPGLRWLLATAESAAATFFLVALRANSTTAGMVYLMLVIWSATQAGVVLSLYIAVLCALGFDYFFLPPYHTLWIVGAQQWIDMFTFAAGCLVVSRLAERARRQARQAEQRRRDVERLYALSQEMMLHGDAEGLIHDLPRLVARIFELEAVALYVRDHDRVHASPAEAPASVAAGLRSLQSGMQAPVELTLGFQASPLTLGMRLLGALGWTPACLSREVSAAVAAQVAIVVARSIAIETSTRMVAARESERLRSALVDSLTHELRTPLTAIRAASTTLLSSERLDDAGRLDMIQLIDEEAAHLDALIGEAVEMAELDANVLHVHLAPHHPRTLLEQAVEASRPALTAHRVRIQMDEPNHSAWFDPQLLGRVLRHLLENAAHHTPPATRITLSSRRSGDRLEFCVADDGPGIASHDLPLIFEKFYRGKGGPGPRKGSGMGLAIVRALLAVHGGSIEVTSQPGAGAAFRFWVPLIEKEPTLPPPSAVTAASGR